MASKLQSPTSPRTTGADDAVSSSVLGIDRTVLCLLIVASIVFHLQILWVNREKVLTPTGDFVAFYSAAQIVSSGRGASLYDIATQREFQQRLPPQRQRPLLYYHPPFEVLLYLPLAHFPYAAGYIIWSLLNAICLVAFGFLLRPYISALHRSLGSGLSMLLPFSFFPALMVFIQAQDSIIFLLVFTLVFVSLRKGREFPAGMCMALGTFRFQLMLPIVLAFLIRKRWKVLAGFLAAFSGLLLISLQITGWQGGLAYARLLWNINEAVRTSPEGKFLYYISPEAMPNLRGFFDAHLASRLPETFIMLAVLVLSALLILWSLGKGVAERIYEKNGFDLPFALYTTVILIVSYHMHLHDVTLLLLPLLLVSNHLAKSNQIGGSLRRSLALLILVLLFTLTYLVPAYFSFLNWLVLLFAAFAWFIAVAISRQKLPAVASI